jgi:hypothetical protein
MYVHVTNEHALGGSTKRCVNLDCFSSLNYDCFRPDIELCSKVLAKKFNDIWYSGTVMDLTKPEKTYNAGDVSILILLVSKQLRKK